MPDGPTPRRRSGLLQDRSRQTRKRLVRAALDLWTQRGFESGVEQTTIEEIVQAAGVTKGTFYFHFARKEEILLEMGRETAAVLDDEVQRCLERKRPLDESMARVLHAVGRHVRSAPPAAVSRAIAEFRRNGTAPAIDAHKDAFAEGFEALLTQARAAGELPVGADPADTARMLQAVVMDAILEWTRDPRNLPAILCRRARIVLDGLGAAPAPPGGRPAGATP